MGLDVLSFMNTAVEMSRLKTKAITPLKLNPERNSVTHEEIRAIAW